MSIHDVRERLAQARAQVASLRDQVQVSRSAKSDCDVARYARENGRDTVRLGDDFKLCKTLQGHTGKIYSLDWAYQAEDRIVSASGDGRLIVWNAVTCQKTHAIKLPCPWVMACAFSPSGRFAACGGLDNICSIFDLDSAEDADGQRSVFRTLSGHKSYLSSCRYMPYQEAHLITSSGDETCILWDAEKGQRISVFGGENSSGHTGAVMSVAVSTVSPPQVFVSGSCDKTARLWDTRMKNAPQTFHGHDGDVNAVSFMPKNSTYFGTASDDGSCRVFDTRTGHSLQMYNHRESAKVLAIAFSISGHLMFSSYDNGDCYIWDTLTAQVVVVVQFDNKIVVHKRTCFALKNNFLTVCSRRGVSRIQIISNLADDEAGHRRRISCLSVVRDGSALCTGSWDNNLKAGNNFDVGGSFALLPRVMVRKRAKYLDRPSFPVDA